MIDRLKQFFLSLLGIAELIREFQHIDASFMALAQSFRDLRKTLETPRPVFVMVVSPQGWTMGQRVDLTPGFDQRITFTPMQPLPKGCFVFAQGDASITDVTVGNMAQSISYPNESPFCITRDAAEIGNLIRVGVRSTIPKPVSALS